VDVVEHGDHGGLYSIGAVPASAPLTVTGQTLTLRYAEPEDAARLLQLGGDAGVTRFFSWGPYTRVEEPQAYIAGLAGKRERGEMLEFLIDHHEHGPIGVTGLSELSVRDRRATVGSWVGRDYWGTGANAESKALVAALGFGTLGLERLTAWTNTRNGRSQRALERVGFRREGVLRNWHRHGAEMHDVVVFGMVRGAWEASRLRELPAAVQGTPPAPFVLA
jgi:[ribosomal protein S5]-alanine N-acetyltransferase